MNGFFNVKSVDSVYWTLLIEIKFYIIIGFILFFNKIKTNYMTFFIIKWLIISYLQLVINCNLILKIISKILIINQSSYFIAGMTLFKIYKEKKHLIFVPILMLCYVLSIVLALKQVTNLAISLNSNFNNLVIILCLTFFYIIMFMMTIDKLNFLNLSMFLKLGLLTYPLYLIHQNFGFIIFNIYGARFNKYFLLSLIIIFMLIISFCINRYLESKFSKNLSTF